MERYIFFNSALGDLRTYQASDFAEYFGSVLSTGLLHTDNVPGMSASVETGTLNTVLSAGKAIMKGHFYDNTATTTLTHSIPEPTLNRIDRVVLRLDLRNSERNILLHVKEGVASSTPVAPALQRDNFIHEISLARILVRANTVQLLQSDLVDERLDETLCGLVYSLISIPTSQFQAEWDAFMAGIQDSGFATTQSVTDLQTEVTTHKADYLKHTGYAVATGSANTYIATLNPALSAYAEGISLRLKINVANTGASTVNVNGLGAKAIKKSNGNDVASGNLKLGSVYTLAYDGTSFILQGEGGEYGTAVASDVLTGKTIGTENGIVTGTLVQGKKWARVTATAPGTANWVISGLPFSPSKLKLTLQSPTNVRVFSIINVDFTDQIAYYSGGILRTNTLAINNDSGVLAQFITTSTKNADGITLPTGYKSGFVYEIDAYE